MLTHNPFAVANLIVFFVAQCSIYLNSSNISTNLYYCSMFMYCIHQYFKQ